MGKVIDSVNVTHYICIRSADPNLVALRYQGDSPRVMEEIMVYILAEAEVEFVVQRTIWSI